MNEYKKTISKERLLTPKDANNELTEFMLELFRVLGYEMTIVYRDDKYNGQREIKATWEKLKHKTNADRIRAMTDEELAELIGDNIDCSICKKEVFETTTCPGTLTADGKDCYGCWLNWLRQEAKDAL